VVDVHTTHHIGCSVASVEPFIVLSAEDGFRAQEKIGDVNVRAALLVLVGLAAISCGLLILGDASASIEPGQLTFGQLVVGARDVEFGRIEVDCMYESPVTSPDAGPSVATWCRRHHAI
jgi:hypothetical protein